MRVLAAIVALCALAIPLLQFRHWQIGDPRRASKRAVWIAIIVFLASGTAAFARPSPYPTVTSFNGDRYSAHAQADKARYLYPTRKRPPVSRQKWRAGPTPAGRPVTSNAYRVDGARIIGGRPAGCPTRFCGCGASLYLFGKIIPTLNLAANWLRFPRSAPAPDMVAARRGHVFVLKRHIAGNTWLVFDANSGGGRTRLHHRSIAGFSIVNPRSTS
jgi:hypothetical protein